MPMILSKEAVDRLVLDDGQFFFDSDPALRGFAVRLRKDTKGRLVKTWIVQYKTDAGQRRRVIGNAARMRADVARRKAAAWIAEVEKGNDPAADKDEDRRATALKFEAAVSLYLGIKEKKVRPTSLRLTRLYLTGHYFKPLHAKPLTKITRKDIAPCLNSIEAESGTTSAGRARAHLSAFLTWSMKQGHLDQNPRIGTEGAKTGKRDRVLTDLELAAVWNACPDNHFGRIVRLLLLTGQRRDEIGGLRWTEVDLDAGTITIPGERTKNHREHKLTLPKMAMDLIPDRQVGRDFVFGDYGQGFTNWGFNKKKLDEQLGFGKPFVLHDLRRSAVTGMATIGIFPHHIEAIVNHVSGHKGGIAGVYNKAGYDKEMKAALAAWAVHVRKITTGETGDDESNVVEFRAA
jgi:integrase